MLTNESTWSLLYNLYAKRSRGMRLIRVTINRDVAFWLKRPIHTAIVFVPDCIMKHLYYMDSHKDLQAELLISLGPGFCHRKCIGGTFTILPDRVDIWGNSGNTPLLYL